MQEVTLGLAILLGAGFLFAKLGQLVRLPSVTGYILAGILLGPSGLALVTHEVISHRLDHFTQIALMLIAFGIGEHVELKKMTKTFRIVGAISTTEISTVFFLVSIGTFLALRFASTGAPAWDNQAMLGLAILLGAISIATAPATVLHVVREFKATGLFTTTLMQTVAVNNWLAIVLFGMAATAARHLVGAESLSFFQASIAGFREVFFSLLVGVVTGLLIDFINSRLKQRDEMLIAGLALLLLCGEGARAFGLSPLLAGIAAGFTIVNRDARDVRFFRALNAFEAPVYVLFFTLAGAHLDLATLPAVGVLGLTYFVCRALGKTFGAAFGGRLAKAPEQLRRNMGLALLPQAGIAIGLLLLVQSDPDLKIYSVVITPVVLASVVLAELLGTVCVRYALEKAGETEDSVRTTSSATALRQRNGIPQPPQGVQLVPWSWEPLRPSVNPNGVVLFGASNIATVGGLARMSTMFAHYHEALPMAVRVIAPDQLLSAAQSKELFEVETEETKRLGYPLKTMPIKATDIPSGILAAARVQKTFGIFLGYPLQTTAQEFERVVEKVTKKARCPVIVVRFAGVLHTEKILVPVTSRKTLNSVRSVIRALCAPGGQRITLLYLLPSDVSVSELDLASKKLCVWARMEGISSLVNCKAMRTETRVNSIVKEAADHDLLVMSAGQRRGLRRLVFGSLAESVARKCHKPMLIIHDPSA